MFNTERCRCHRFTGVTTLVNVAAASVVESFLGTTLNLDFPSSSLSLEDEGELKIPDAPGVGEEVEEGRVDRTEPECHCNLETWGTDGDPL